MFNTYEYRDFMSSINNNSYAARDSRLAKLHQRLSLANVQRNKVLISSLAKEITAVLNGFGW